MALFDRTVTPNIDGLIRTLKRQGTPDRVYNMELFLDREIHEAVRQKFNTAPGLKPGDPLFDLKRTIANYRFLGYDFVWSGMGNMGFPRKDLHAAEPLAKPPDRFYM
ncbi:MAG: hypothetical protein ABIF71_14965 [Planctomycetota bacterium]